MIFAIQVNDVDLGKRTYLGFSMIKLHRGVPHASHVSRQSHIYDRICWTNVPMQLGSIFYIDNPLVYTDNCQNRQYCRYRPESSIVVECESQC